jgi:GT2 family glycosyltransferase
MNRIAIVIVGFRCGADIAACVRQLSASTHPAFDIHVIENGGQSSFADLRTQFAPLSSEVPADARAAPPPRTQEKLVLRLPGDQRLVLYRAVGNLGYAGGINTVLTALADDPSWSAVWILNPDTEPEPGALAALLRRLDEGDYGIVGSRLVLKSQGFVQMYAGRWRPWLARGFNIGRGRPVEEIPDVDAIEREMDYVCGASMLVRRSYIEAVGPMQEDYFLYAEEVDWCLRRGSYRLGYAHDSIVVHEQGATIGTHADRRLRSGFSIFLDERSKLLLTRRFYPRIYPLVAIAALMLTFQYLKARAYANFGHAISGWWAGLRGETGFPARFSP